jgi:hypothetical protein
MQKLYKIVTLMLIATLFFTSNISQAQNCCIDCQADVKAVSDKQVLLEKIDIKEGTTVTNFNTNVYVSYRSGNAQKFWANVAIATAGVAVSTQLNSSPITAGDSKVQNSVSPIVPLGISVATLPGIWKNRPRGVPQAGLWIQHRNLKGELLETWEQAISDEAKNSAELLNVAVDKPLSEGTLEIYLQNDSKNEVYFWGLQTLKKVVDVVNKIVKNAPQKPSSARAGACSIDVYGKDGSRAAGLGGSSANTTTSSEDLEAQGYNLLYSIPFDCGTGKVIDGGNGVIEGTDAYDAYREFMRQAAEYNSQNPTTGGGGGSGGSTGGGGNPQGPIEVGNETEDPQKRLKCVECMHNAHEAYDSGVKLLKLRVAGAMVACPAAAVGSFFTAETALSWLNLFPPGSVAAQVISFLAGIGVGGYCVAETIYNLEHDAAVLKTDFLDAINNCDSRYCK